MVDGVDDDEEVPDDVGLPVDVTDAVALELIVDDGVYVGDTVALNDKDEVLLAVAPKLREPVCEAVTVEDRLAAIDSLSLLELVPVGVELDVLEPVPDEVLVGLFEGDIEGV